MPKSQLISNNINYTVRIGGIFITSLNVLIFSTTISAVNSITLVLLFCSVFCELFFAVKVIGVQSLRMAYPQTNLIRTLNSTAIYFLNFYSDQRLSLT